MTQAIFGEGKEHARREIIKEHKLGRFDQPSEIAAAFLLSADASFRHRPRADGRRRPHRRT
jgi:hypothetical protein